jgi:hypothetical protein
MLLSGRQIFGTEGGLRVLPGLAELFENGQFKLPTNVELVGEGFEASQPGLERLIKGGVSGNKYVVSI